MQSLRWALPCNPAERILVLSVDIIQIKVSFHFLFTFSKISAEPQKEQIGMKCRSLMLECSSYRLHMSKQCSLGLYKCDLSTLPIVRLLILKIIAALSFVTASCNNIFRLVAKSAWLVALMHKAWCLPLSDEGRSCMPFVQQTENQGS